MQNFNTTCRKHLDEYKVWLILANAWTEGGDLLKPGNGFLVPIAAESVSDEIKRGTILGFYSLTRLCFYA